MPFECGSKVDLTGLKQQIIDNHSSYHETEIHNDSPKRSDSIPCEKVSESHDINPLRNEDLNASAVHKASCQNNSELDQCTQFASLQVDSVATCPFECGTKVDLIHLKQLMIDKHSSSHETEIHNDSPKRSDSIPCEKVSESHDINPLRNEDLNASAVKKASC